MVPKVLAVAAAVLVLAAVAAAEPRRSRGGAALNKTEAGANRKGKVFSLFNLVTFENEECTSTSTISGGGTGSTRRNGTCFTQEECNSKGGTANGNCAAGFGVCCVFIVDETGSDINQNCTYIQNPNYPSTYSETSNVMYTVNRCDDTVCSVRLDFESFTIQGTGNTLEGDTADPTQAGGNCQDTFDVTTSTGQRVPQICGQNSGQHMYIDIGRGSSDSAQLAFTFGNTNTVNRQWEIKVTQVKCGFHNAPNGCLQYHTGLTGRLTTFNFMPTNDNHLKEQDYSICIRQEAGFCCVQYTPCADEGSFTLDTAAATAIAGAHTACSLDYISISGSSTVCGSATSHSSYNRYCGSLLSITIGSDLHNDVICDCTAPFAVDIHTDAVDDMDSPDGTNTARSRGVCLTYHQVPCNT